MKLKVKGIKKSFGDKEILHGISFEVESGRALGLLGRNGAGKTTTIRVLMDVFRPNGGEILADGKPFVPKEHKIGYLPEERGLYPQKKVLDQMVYLANLRGMGTKEAKESGKWWLDRLEIGEYADRKLETLSKGNQQKVQLAQTLICNPDIIILDEPTVGLDPKQIIEIRELIRELAKEHTVILSSHILAEVREVCDYIMIISRGKLVASDTPENLEHLMAGQNSLEIETKAEPERVRKILRSISGIDKIELERTEEATTYARIETGTAASGEDQDIREAIFLAFAEAGCPLLMLKASKASLEEVFMELTQGEEATADAGDL